MGGDGTVATLDEAVDFLVGRGLLHRVMLDCPFCGTPRRRARGLCTKCRTLGAKHQYALKQLDVVAFATVDDPLEGLIREWKDRLRWTGGTRASSVLASLAVPLAAYMGCHAAAWQLGS